MRNRERLCASAGLALVLGTAVPGFSQTYEDTGVRARGMGGAFVAVADDATASWWNPAGLASGAYLSAVVERGRITEPADPPPGTAAAQHSFGDFAVAFPALGLSYYTVRVGEIVTSSSTGERSASREDERTSGTRVRSSLFSQFGVTVGQSIGEHLVIGSTLKLVRAGATISPPGSGSLDDLNDADVPRGTRGDLDVGAMANWGRIRVGAAVRNVTEPSFEAGADRLALARQARAGVAFYTAPNALSRGVKVAADADLTTVRTAVGEVRHVAAGTEVWLQNGRVGVRGGLSANTVGEWRPAVSGGVTVALTRAFHVNASRTTGRDESITGWSTSVSATF